MDSSPIKLIVAIIIIYAISLLVTSQVKPIIQKSIVITGSKEKSSDPMGAEKIWMRNLFLPFENTFPKDLAKRYEACKDLPVKNAIEASKKFKEINKCVMTVATALEVWKYAEQKIENPNFSYMKEYGINEKEIKKLEEIEKEMAKEMKKIENETNPNLIKAKEMMLAEKLAREISIGE